MKMNKLKSLSGIILILFMSGVFPAASEEVNPRQDIEEGKEVEVFDFRETPMVDVLRVFAELTGKNVIASKEAMGVRITLFLKDVSAEDALKTMCRIYNLWFIEEDDIIRIMTTEEYLEELIVRRDATTIIHRLRYASCFAVADLLGNLFGPRIEYIPPADVEAFGHIGVGRVGVARDRVGVGRAHVRREAFIPEHRREERVPSEVIEELERRIEEKVKLEDVLEARREEAIVYLTIFPRDNSILVRSVDKRILEEISNIIKEIDTPTRQVLLEGKILEFTLTDELKSFFDFDVRKREWRVGGGKFTPLDVATFIFELMDKEVRARVELFEEKGLVRVIGTPMLLSANNAPGEFFIGEERPITISYEHEIREFPGRVTETVRPVIELRDIGTKLIITPSINEDRTVTMRFLAEVDTVRPGGASFSFVTKDGRVITLPIDTVDTSRVENIIVARDGSTLAIGGLIREGVKDHERRIPLLGDIPVLGLFFRRVEVREEKTETVFLVTPHIMMAPEEAEPVSEELMRRLSDHPYIKDKE
jgi:general secretion pathway protein D